MAESQQSFAFDSQAALEEAMALLDQKGIIIEKYIEKMTFQQNKITELREQIQRLNWESREREYNQEELRRIPIKNLIEEGFVQEIIVNGGSYEEKGCLLQSGKNKGCDGVEQESGDNGECEQKLEIVKILLRQNTEEIILSPCMQLYKDNNPPIGNNLDKSCSHCSNQPNRNEQQLTLYCSRVMKQLQQMKTSLEDQNKQQKYQLETLSQQNSQLLSTITIMQQKIKELNQQLVLKQLQHQQFIKQSQTKISTLKQSSQTTQTYLMQQIRQKLLQIETINDGFSKCKMQHERVYEENAAVINGLKKQLTLMSQSNHQLLQRLNNNKKKLQSSEITKLQTQAQTQPQLVMDVEFLKKTRLQIMQLSPENYSSNKKCNANRKNSKQQQHSAQYEQTHHDNDGIEYKICVPPSLDVIAFDFDHSLTSSANVSPQRKLSNASSSSFYSNDRQIEEMYTIPKRGHKYLSQPMISHHVEVGSGGIEEQYEAKNNSNNNNNCINQRQQQQQQLSQSQQEDRIRVTPDDSQPDSTKKNSTTTSILPVLHELKLKPKVASYSQKNMIMEELDQDDDQYQQNHQYNQHNKNEQPNTHNHKMINYVTLAHHNNQHKNHQNYHIGNTFIKLKRSETTNPQHSYNYLQPSKNNGQQQQQSDDLIPSRSALSESSTSSIKQNHNIHTLQEKFDFNIDQDPIVDDNLGDSDHPSETYKNSLRFPNGYSSGGSLEKIQRNRHNEYHMSYQLSKSIGYNNLRHSPKKFNLKQHQQKKQQQQKKKQSSSNNAKQLLELKSPQIVMKSLIDKSFPIQKTPFKLSSQFINVAELLKQEKHCKMDYLTVQKNKSSNPGSDSLVNIMIDSHQQQDDHVQISTSNPGTTKQKQSQQQKQKILDLPINNRSNYKTPKKHKTIQLTQSLDFQSLNQIENQNSGQNNINTKSKKKHKIIYLRR